MKKQILIPLYFGFLACTVLLSSACQDDPIVPNDPTGNTVDTTWVNDSTGTGGNGNPNDTLGGNGNPNDSTGWNDPTGGGNPWDTLGGGGNPNDTLGG